MPKPAPKNEKTVMTIGITRNSRPRRALTMAWIPAAMAPVSLST